MKDPVIDDAVSRIGARAQTHLVYIFSEIVAGKIDRNVVQRSPYFTDDSWARFNAICDVLEERSQKKEMVVL